MYWSFSSSQLTEKEKFHTALGTKVATLNNWPTKKSSHGWSPVFTKDFPQAFNEGWFNKIFACVIPLSLPSRHPSAGVTCTDHTVWRMETATHDAETKTAHAAAVGVPWPFLGSQHDSFLFQSVNQMSIIFLSSANLFKAFMLTALDRNYRLFLKLMQYWRKCLYWNWKHLYKLVLWNYMHQT